MASAASHRTATAALRRSSTQLPARPYRDDDVYASGGVESPISKRSSPRER
jgi:hypothetical protein